MTLSTGDTAPDFELPDENGVPQRLSSLLASGPVVLFFYPAAMTSGCTKESCHFRDLAAEFTAAGAHRVGISRDAVARQKEFSTKNGFDYPLLSDEDQSVAEAFGVKRSGLLSKVTPVKRATFVIGQDGIIKDAITSETKMEVHADQALRALGTA
jgi:peroxiredoxin Q/BCP